MYQEQVKKVLDFLKEKLKKSSEIISRGRKTKLGLVIMILVPVIIVASVGTFFFLQEEQKAKEEAKKAAQEAAKEFQPKTAFGQLEISVLGAQEGSYPTFERVGEEVKRVEKKYYLVYTRVFNPSNTDKVTFSSIKLVDDLKNEYLPDISILFDLRGSPQGFKEFGLDMVMYPRVIREGNIVFPAIAQGAQKLKLVFETEDGERAMIEFEK